MTGCCVRSERSAEQEVNGKQFSNLEECGVSRQIATLEWMEEPGVATQRSLEGGVSG